MASIEPKVLDQATSPAMKRAYELIARVVNGRIAFGDTHSNANIDGVWVTVVSSTPNTDFVVTHNLARVPVGYIVMSKSAACDVYVGSVVGTSTQLTLRATAAGVTLVLFVV